MKPTYELVESEKNGFNEVIIKNNNSEDRISVIPQLGARLNEAILVKNGTSFSVLNKIDPKNIITRDELFNNAKLFPFANRIKNGTYLFNGSSYQLPLNYEEENNSCHGLVYNKEFKLIEFNADKDKASVTFEYKYDGSMSGYPFGYCLLVTYELNDDAGISCKTKIINTSGEKLMFSDGWHHYFNLDEKINDLSLKTEINSVIIMDNRGIPTGDTKEIISNGAGGINNQVFDNIYKVNCKEKIVTELYSAAKNIQLSIWQEASENKYRYLIIYTPPDRKSIAIEPMTSNIDAFNNRQNIIELEPNDFWEASFGFYIK